MLAYAPPSNLGTSLNSAASAISSRYRSAEVCSGLLLRSGFHAADCAGDGSRSSAAMVRWGGIGTGSEGRLDRRGRTFTACPAVSTIAIRYSGGTMNCVRYVEEQAETCCLFVFTTAPPTGDAIAQTAAVSTGRRQLSDAFGLGYWRHCAERLVLGRVRGWRAAADAGVGVLSFFLTPGSTPR